MPIGVGLVQALGTHASALQMLVASEAHAVPQFRGSAVLGSRFCAPHSTILKKATCFSRTGWYNLPIEQLL